MLTLALLSLIAGGRAGANGDPLVTGGLSVEQRCDGFDDDGDGRVDEGHPDSDGDGTADCVDADNDNDGVADDDEIARGSNPADRASTPEVCDGADNDVDLLIDEGLDGCDVSTPGTDGGLQEPEPSPGGAQCPGTSSDVTLTPNSRYAIGLNAVSIVTCGAPTAGGSGVLTIDELIAQVEADSGFRTIIVWHLDDGRWLFSFPAHPSIATLVSIDAGVAALVFVLE